MSQQYHFYPQPELPATPLLDQQNNPTPLLTSFAGGVFNYLDHACEPKGSGLLEESKIAAMQAFILPHKHHIKMQEFRPVVYNSYYMAFSVETSFSVNGPSVTRAGFLTYLRAMIMSDPDEAFKDFATLNQRMQLGYQFSRFQFPREADPKARNIDKGVNAYISKVLTAIGMKVHQGAFCDICLNRIPDTYHACQDCDDYAVCQDCIALAPKRHNSVHKFKFTGSQEVVHEGINCDICFNTIVGVRHNCKDCDDYDLCQRCLPLAPQRHTPGHRFKAIERSASASQEELNAVRVRIALQQMGEEAAIDLISPRVCYVCRRYPCSCGY